MDAIVRAQGGLAAKRWSATCASGAGPAAASHLQVAAAADEPMAWGSSARGAAPAGEQPPAAATGAGQQLESEAVRPLDAGVAAPAGEQALAAATEGDLQLGIEAKYAAAVGGAFFARGLSDAELESDFDAVEAAMPAAVQGLQQPGAQVAQPVPLYAPRCWLGPVLHTWPQPPHPQAPAREVPGMIPAEGDPDFELAHLLPPQAVQGGDPLGGWGTPLPDPDAMDWDFTASEHGLSIQGLQEALKPGDGRPVDMRCTCSSLSMRAAPPIQALCCQQLPPLSYLPFAGLPAWLCPLPVLDTP